MNKLRILWCWTVVLINIFIDKIKCKNTLDTTLRCEEFWRKTLVGRTITDITFEEGALTTLVLDNDRVIMVIKNEYEEATLATYD
jgi:hypothetical protein